MVGVVFIFTGSDSESESGSEEEEEGSSSDEGDTLQNLQKRFGVVPKKVSIVLQAGNMWVCGLVFQLS